MILEYVGRPSQARLDPRGFRQKLEKQFPHVSETGYHAMTVAALSSRPPRPKRLIYHLLGRDILTADLTTVPAWPYFSKSMKSSLSVKTIENRHGLLDPPGLSRSYVWRVETDWRQEVAESDVEVIRASAVRSWFHLPEAAHGESPLEGGFSFEPVETFEARNVDDAKAFVKDRNPGKQWRGLILP